MDGDDFTERDLRIACMAATNAAVEAAGVHIKKVPSADKHVVLASVASSFFSVAAQDFARSQGLNLAPDSPPIVWLYREWAEALALYPDGEAVEKHLNAVRDVFIARYGHG